MPPALHCFGRLSSRANDLPVSRLSVEVTRFWGSTPATVAGCPTSRSFFARCGIPQASPSSLLGRHNSVGVPHVRTSVRGPKRWATPDFLLRAAAGATCAALLKESRMKSINATGLHRKSGGKPHHSLSFRTPPFVHMGPKRRAVREAVLIILGGTKCLQDQWVCRPNQRTFCRTRRESCSVLFINLRTACLAATGLRALICSKMSW